MSSHNVFEGKDLDEAIQVAARELGISEADLHYEVVEQGRKGLLGMGVKNVRIRVKPPVDQLSDEQILSDEEPEVPLAQTSHPDDEGDDDDDELEDVAPAPKRRQEPTNGGSELASDIEDTLQHMFEVTGLRLNASSKVEDGGVTLKIEGADRKMLKQRNAELLLAFQFLLNRMARRTWPGAGRIHLTTNGESRRREEQLIELTRDVAKQVAKTGRTKKLRPMNAYERRIVHLTVREFNGLTSSSDGNGAMKRVRISKVQNALNV